MNIHNIENTQVEIKKLEEKKENLSVELNEILDKIQEDIYRCDASLEVTASMKSGQIEVINSQIDNILKEINFGIQQVA